MSLQLDYKQSVYDGLLMTAGILASTYVVGKVSKNMAPQLTTKNAVSLATVTVLSQVGIDYENKENYFLVCKKV